MQISTRVGVVQAMIRSFPYRAVANGSCGTLKHLHDGLISVSCRSPSAFISLSRSRLNVLDLTTGDEGDHHAANEIIGACGFERVFALDPASRAWRVGDAGRALARDRRRQRPKAVQANHGSNAATPGSRGLADAAGRLPRLGLQRA